MRDFEAKLDAWEEKLSQKHMTIPTDLVAGVLFFVLALVILLMMPAQVTVSETDPVNGRVFPRLLMYLMMACSAALIIKEVVKKVRGEAMTSTTVNLLIEVKALIILAILIVTYLICSLTNLFVVGALFCCLAFLLFFRCKKPLYYVVTLGLAVVIWAAFRFGLNVNF